MRLSLRRSRNTALVILAWSEAACLPNYDVAAGPTGPRMNMDAAAQVSDASRGVAEDVKNRLELDANSSGVDADATTQGDSPIRSPIVTTLPTTDAGLTVTLFTLPDSIHVGAIAVDPKDNVWFVESQRAALGKLSPLGSLTEYAIEAEARTILSGLDSTMWFGEDNAPRIVALSSVGMATTIVDASPGSIFSLAMGPDGNIWLANPVSAELGRFGLDGQNLKRFPVPSGSGPAALTTGPDQNIWFTEGPNGRVARCTPDGHIDEFGPTPSFTSAIVSGSDGAVWFTEIEGQALGRVTTDGMLQQFQLDDTPAFLASDRAGYLWVTLPNQLELARIDPRVLGTRASGSHVEVVATVRLGAGQKPFLVASGSGSLGADNVWFTLPPSGIGMITY